LAESRDADFQEPKLTRNLQLVDLSRRIGVAHDKEPGEVSLAWAYIFDMFSRSIQDHYQKVKSVENNEPSKQRGFHPVAVDHGSPLSECAIQSD